MDERNEARISHSVSITSIRDATTAIVLCYNTNLRRGEAFVLLKTAEQLGTADDVSVIPPLCWLYHSGHPFVIVKALIHPFTCKESSRRLRTA